MKIEDEITSVLARISAILRGGGESEWARAIEKFERGMSDNPHQVVGDIRGIFGGMGSFNDIVLQRDGEPLFRENDELDRLRTKLYDLCRR